MEILNLVSPECGVAFAVGLLVGAGMLKLTGRTEK